MSYGQDKMQQDSGHYPSGTKSSSTSSVKGNRTPTLLLLGPPYSSRGPVPPTSNLVHENKGPLVAVVDIFVGGISHTAMLHLCPACFQVAVPEFVAGGGRHWLVSFMEHQNPSPYPIRQLLGERTWEQ